MPLVVGLEWATVVHVPQVKMVGDTKQPQLSLTESTIPRAYRHHNKAHAITSIKMSLGEARSYLKPADHDSHTK